MRIEVQKMGETIKNRRDVLGLLQSQLADLSGTSTRSIQMIEQGKANPSLETLLKIADPLGLTLDLILKDLLKHER